MIQEINLVRCTCDICKRDFDIKKGEKNPLKELRLPMNHYDETGHFTGITTDKIDVCEGCAEQMVKDMAEHYDVSSISYAGVRIKRKEE